MLYSATALLKTIVARQLKSLPTPWFRPTFGLYFAHILLVQQQAVIVKNRAQETHTTLPHTFSLVKKPLLEVIFPNANGMLIKTHIEQIVVSILSITRNQVFLQYKNNLKRNQGVFGFPFLQHSIAIKSKFHLHN